MRWMWIDSIVRFEADTRLDAIKNVSLAEEHLHDHFEASDGEEARPLVPATLILEGMAQTAGILVGTVNRFREKVILAKVSKAEIDGDVLPGQCLRFESYIERIDAAGASTSGIIRRLDHGEGDWVEIGRIDLMFSHLDKNMRGREFPDHNFVFSDNFRNILVDAGLAYLIDDDSTVPAG